MGKSSPEKREASPLCCRGHGDCRADAEYVADLVREKFGTQDIRIHSIGPVIGSHSGPGTVALFYLGRTRG